MRIDYGNIVIENKVRVEWSNVPEDVAKAVETLLYSIEENQEINMVSHIGDINNWMN